jgi:hypothetical protein
MIATYPVNGTQAEIEAYWTAFFSDNPIDYKNIGGLYPDIPEFTVPVESGNGSFVNVNLMEYKRQQDEFLLRNGDTSKLPKFEAAPETYTDEQKKQHYLVRMKDVGKWVDLFVQQAVEFDKTLRTAGLTTGINFGSLLNLGAGAADVVATYSSSVNAIGTATVAVEALGIVGQAFQILSAISAASEAQINAKRGRYIAENLQYCTNLYKKYDGLIKDLLPKDTGRSAKNPTTNFAPYIIIFIVLLMLILIVKRH